MTSAAPILFISDLHLSQQEPEITRQFMHFLNARASSARALYILGDLFEVWVGDDDPRPEFSELFATLKHTSTQCPIYFMHGNRDFLIGHDFAKSSDIQIIEDPHILTLGNQRIALMHGDQLCTDDLEYMTFREQVRSDSWQQDFLHKPLAERQQIATELRNKSKQAMADKPEQIMDVNADTVAQTIESLDVDILIHGHTHRPGIHHLASDTQRIVLGDWSPNASYLIYEQNRFTLHDPRIKR